MRTGTMPPSPAPDAPRSPDRRKAAFAPLRTLTVAALAAVLLDLMLR